jgi:hypothetical protein
MMMLQTLALDQTQWAGILGVALAALVMVYFGVRYWLVSTRDAAIGDVKTPNVDRLNKNALEHMAEETLEQDEAETEALEDEEPPEDLKAIVPDDPELEKKK